MPLKPPVNNTVNRIALAMTICQKIAKHTLCTLAERWLQHEWENNNEKFETDAKRHGNGVGIVWTSHPDPTPEPEYRCHHCKSTDVTGAFHINLNHPHKKTGEAFSHYWCNACENSRGDGTTKYLDTFNNETGEWEKP